MLVKGTFLSIMSGKLDGIVAARNRGGPYFRAHTNPVDPATAPQLLLREAMSTAYTTWRDLLGPSGRAAWNALAAACRDTNRIGDVRQLNGQQQFTRQFVFRYQAIETYAPTALQNYGAPAPSPSDFEVAPTVTFNKGVEELEIAWDFPQGFEDDDSSLLSVFVSLPFPQTVNFFKGPWLLIGGVSPNNGTVTSPAAIVLPLARQPGPGERIFVRLRLSRPGSMLGRQHLTTLDYPA